MNKKNEKQFILKEKEDYVIYLYEILTRLEKCRISYKDTLCMIEKFIKKKKDEKKDLYLSEIVVDYKNYQIFRKMLMGDEGYIFNLIGDHQEVSISYKKFREIINRNKKRGTLGFEIRDIDEKIENHLKQINKLRNWANHVPESLLVATRELISAKKANEFIRNPVQIYLHTKCTLELIQDLYKESHNIYNITMEVLTSIKKDYGYLVGETIYIEKLESNYISGVTSAARDVTIRSAEIQKLGS